MKYRLDEEKLEELLSRAHRAHIDYEEQLGHDDDEWATWYAEFIMSELEDEDE